MKTKLEIHKDSFTLGGEPFYLASGDMHYFRYFKGGWKRRLQLMKDFGLTAVQTYVPWNLHEPEEGEFHFEDNLNISEFLKLCDEVGLKVLFRPSVYMCSEWDYGGLPYWLQSKPNMCIRSMDEEFIGYAKRYYTRLAKEFVPYLSTNGGPIIAVAVENEYGSLADDGEYLKWTGDLLKELGVDVPLYTANGFENYKLKYGTNENYWTCLDLHKLTDEAIENIRAIQPDKPIFIAELWTGRGYQQGGFFARQMPEDVAKNYKSILEKGAFVNFYMFCGGTNYGFLNGALKGRYNCGVTMPDTYIPFATSYDVDAPVNEYGEPTKKYYMCKKVLKDYIENNGYKFTGTDDFDDSPKVTTQAPDKITLTKSADLLSQAKELGTKTLKSGKPLTMDALGQDYGFILYTTYVRHTDDLQRMLIINDLHDRALIYIDGKYVGYYMRDREYDPVKFYVPKEGVKIEILVENLGRINYGFELLNDKKGICGYLKLDLLNEDGSIVDYNYGVKFGFENTSLPFKDISKVNYDTPSTSGRPAIFEGTFDAKPGVDTFINIQNMQKGNIWINGFNIGRYWNVGPQGTLYIPGELLKEHNTIHVLELHNDKNECKLSFENKPQLDTIDREEFFNSKIATGSCTQSN